MSAGYLTKRRGRALAAIAELYTERQPPRRSDGRARYVAQGEQLPTDAVEWLLERRLVTIGPRNRDTGGYPVTITAAGREVLGLSRPAAGAIVLDGLRVQSDRYTYRVETRKGPQAPWEFLAFTGATQTDEEPARAVLQRERDRLGAHPDPELRTWEFRLVRERRVVLAGAVEVMDE